MENYAIHIAPKGGKIDLIVDQIQAERCAASEKRMEYSQKLGAEGNYGNDGGVAGLLGASAFSARIGSAPCIIKSNGRGYQMLYCWYQRIGGVTFVMTPWRTSTANEDSSVDECEGDGVKTAFQPEGCERVPLSVYYAAKEKAEAAGVAGAGEQTN